MALQVLREEFRLKNLWYTHPDPTVFWKYQWICWDIEHLAIRVVLAGYVLYAWIHEIVHYYQVAVNHALLPGNDTDTNTTALVEGERPEPDLAAGWDTRRPWYVFLTLWAYTVLMLHLVLACILSVVFTLRRPRKKSMYELESSGGSDNQGFDGGEDGVKPGVGSSVQTSGPSSQPDGPLAWYFKLSWFLADIITPVAPIVTLIFFTALYQGGPVSLFNANVHIMNTVLVILDQYTTARPIRLLHIWAPMTFGLVYNVFNYVFWTFDHVEHVLYPGVLDWRTPGRTLVVMAIVSLVVIPSITFLWFLVYRMKLAIYAWRYRNKPQ